MVTETRFSMSKVIIYNRRCSSLVLSTYRQYLNVRIIIFPNRHSHTVLRCFFLRCIFVVVRLHSEKLCGIIHARGKKINSQKILAIFKCHNEYQREGKNRAPWKIKSCECTEGAKCSNERENRRRYLLHAELVFYYNKTNKIIVKRKYRSIAE